MVTASWPGTALLALGVPMCILLICLVGETQAQSSTDTPDSGLVDETQAQTSADDPDSGLVGKTQAQTSVEDPDSVLVGETQTSVEDPDSVLVGETPAQTSVEDPDSVLVGETQAQTSVEDPDSVLVGETQAQTPTEDPDSDLVGETQSQSLADTPESALGEDTLTPLSVDVREPGLIDETQPPPGELQEPGLVESGEITAIYDALTAIESVQGAYSYALSEQLYSLGLAFQIQNQHKEAFAAFKRGIHLTRINNGLHSLEQIPFIQAEINSSLMTGDFENADLRQAYLLKVQLHSLPSGEQFTDAMMQQADWQQKAWELGVGGNEASFFHLTSMAHLYRMAIQDIMQSDGPKSPRALAPLYGLMKTQYLISSAENSGYSGSARLGTELTPVDSYQVQAFKMGKSIIESIYNLEMVVHGEDSVQVAKTFVMLGDWMLWNNKRNAAHEAYVNAIEELSERDDAEIEIAHIFGNPTPMPDFDGIRTLPPSVEPGEDKVLLQFSVNLRGRVIDMERLDEYERYDRQKNKYENNTLSDLNEKKVQRLMRKIRGTKFRPRYDGLNPVVTENILRAYEVE